MLMEAKSFMTNDADPCEWTNLAGNPDYSEIIETLRGQLPQEPVPIVETKPFDYSANSQKYYKEFREKKLIERIRRD